MLYVNPGYAELLKDVAKNFTTIRNDTCSKTGVAFVYTSSESGSTTVNFMPPSNGIFIRFDWYSHGNWSCNFQITIPIYASYGTYSDYQNLKQWLTITRQSNSHINITAPRITTSSGISTTYVNRNFYDSNFDFNVKEDKINTFYLRAIGSDVKYTINGSSKYAGVDSINTSEVTRKIGAHGVVSIKFPTSHYFLIGDNFKFGSSDVLCFSNIIISNQYIPPEAEIAIVPPSDIDTDMASLEGGKYRIDSNNQQLLMTPNMTNLLDTYSKSSQVYGIAPAGVPFERSGSGALTLTGLSKDGDSITAHDTVSVADTDKGFDVPWYVDGSMKLEDLQDKQYGFKSS